MQRSRLQEQFHENVASATAVNSPSMQNPANWNSLSHSQYRAQSPEAHMPDAAELKLQRAFQHDIEVAAPLFSARQIASRHLKTGFSIHGMPEGEKVELYTTRMLSRNPRGDALSVSPVVINYTDDTEHGRRTQASMKLDRKQENKDLAKSFVERHGISILGNIHKAEAKADTSLPGVQNRKNRVASPPSSHTHMSGHAEVHEGSFDASSFRFGRKMLPASGHATNLTRTLLPVRKIKTPSVACLASPPRNPRGLRSGYRHAIDTNRVLTPDMIPLTRQPRLRSIAPEGNLTIGGQIKDGAKTWKLTGGLRGNYLPASDPWRGADEEPYGDEHNNRHAAASSSPGHSSAAPL